MVFRACCASTGPDAQTIRGGQIGGFVWFSGILDALQRLVDLEGLSNLDDALRNVGAIAILVDPAEHVVAQTEQHKQGGVNGP